MTGTFINVGAVVLAGTLGALLGDRLPTKIRETTIAGLGLVTLLIGIQFALKTENLLIVLGSISVGGIIGELIGLDEKLQLLGAWLERQVGALTQRFGGKGVAGSGRAAGDFTRGFVTASLVFCVGPFAIIGSLQDGLSGDYSALAVKSMLDGFASLAFAASFGVGVVFSALVVFFYQGFLTVGAGWLKDLLTEPMITEMTATGGLLIIGISLGLLQLKTIRVTNFMPAIALAPLAVAALAAFS